MNSVLIINVGDKKESVLLIGPTPVETESDSSMTDETTAVVGEETLDTSGVEVKEIPLVKAGLYPATFHGVSIHCGREWNSVPNVNLMHKLKENNRIVFSTMLMGMHPDKNGQLNIQRKNGLKAFLKTIGTDIEKLRVIKKTVTNPANGEAVELKYCDAEQVKAALEQYVKQAEYRIRVTERSAANGFPAKNDVFEFLPLSDS